MKSKSWNVHADNASPSKTKLANSLASTADFAEISSGT